MDNEIGENFSDELKAAGLFGLPFSWGDDGTFTFDPSMKQNDIEAVLKLYEVHAPLKTEYAAEPS
ncbi:hypothetical protein PS934_04487 [Pseudomonas fluorescens]|uniref:hypothetical protein n=1 Tax=Pseudomonas fluorescens TaxID=294 RepID=UPI0012405844|nr:hypothetical protein [Pseudomonas fluorescens]VVQ17262.1 hypothetical protein PS934_04487 [Pseudomonas fluorescens]